METTLAGHYQVIEPLGMGGFGQTFLAKDMHLPGNPLCVVKQLKPRDSDSATLTTAQRFFEREAEMLYRLGEHDQIPRLLAHFEQDGKFYLVQDYIEGQTLHQELAHREKLSEASVMRILQDILQVLTFVHQENVIHRDIKPANLIRRNRDGKIVLIFIIEADPGVGKTAILAEYVKRTRCVAHFNVRSQGINRAEEFLKCVCTQLIERYKLPYSLPLTPEHTRDGNFLARLLNEISTLDTSVDDTYATTTLTTGAKSTSKLVIAVDALDEVDLSSHTLGANVLYLPASLPQSVYFILTKRMTPVPMVVNHHRVFELMQYATESLQDAKTYIRCRVNHSEALQTWIGSQGLTVEEFVTTLAEKSDRNFMYLRYVLPAIESGTYQDLTIENLPEGLEQYYYQHWQNMGMTAKPLPRTKIKIVYVLAEARKPVSRQLISEFSGEDALTVQEVLDEWQQFLREQRIDGQTGYSIYHTSFQDFLHHQDIVQAAGVTIQGINAMIADNLAQELGL
ncbi:protein kinase [Microcoleus sp. ZQ-A2]